MSLRLESIDDDRVIVVSPARGVVVGRARDCDVQITDDDALSRYHCRLSLADAGDELLVRDLGSLNGTYVNGRRITGECPLRTGGGLRIGRTRYRLARPTPDEAASSPNDAVETGHAPGAADSAHATGDPLAPARPAAPAPLPPRPWWFRPRMPSNAPSPPRREPAVFVEPPASASHPEGDSDEEPPRVFVIASDAELAVVSDAELVPGPLPAVQPAAAPPRQPELPPAQKPPDTPRDEIEPPPSGELQSLVVTRLERRARALPRKPAAEPPGDEPARRDLSVGYGIRPTAGRGWNGTRDALDGLTLVSAAGLLVVTGVVSLIFLRAFMELGKNGLSVFIPFGTDARQFEQYELVQIGFALAAVGGALAAVIHSAFRHADEFTGLILWGLGAGLAGVCAAAAGPQVLTVLMRGTVVLLAAWALASAALLARCYTAPVRARQKLSVAVATAALLACAACLGFCLRFHEGDLTALDIPMAAPRIAPVVLGAAAAALVAMLSLAVFVRRIAISYGDEPTFLVVQRYLIYAGATGLLSLLFVGLINARGVGGWWSGLLALVTLTMLLVGSMLFVQLVGATRYILR